MSSENVACFHHTVSYLGVLVTALSLYYLLLMVVVLLNMGLTHRMYFMTFTCFHDMSSAYS